MGDGVKGERKETLEVGGVHNLICMHELNRTGLGGGRVGTKRKNLYMCIQSLCELFSFIKVQISLAFI
jgi:hypothetical protein